MRDSIERTLRALGNASLANSVKIEKSLNSVFEEFNVKAPASLWRTILETLSERDDDADIYRDIYGRIEADTKLTDYERVPLNEEWQQYFEREIKRFVDDAWVNESYTDERDGNVGKVGYEINFNRYFYKYVPSRKLEEIETDLQALEKEISNLLQDIIR